jgi:hypothetical protein
LIETIPAIELPTAIAFLEFLKQRSTEALAKDEHDHEHDDHDHEHEHDDHDIPDPKAS